jgi:lysozyme family protein
MKIFRIPLAIAGLALGLSGTGCAGLGGLVSGLGPLIQLALAVAAIALPYYAWYYYEKHQE